MFPTKSGDDRSSGRRRPCLAIVPFGVDFDSLNLHLAPVTPKSDGMVSSMPAPTEPGSPTAGSERGSLSEPLPGGMGDVSMGTGSEKTPLPFNQTVCAVKTCRQVICRQPSRCHVAIPKYFEIGFCFY